MAIERAVVCHAWATRHLVQELNVGTVYVQTTVIEVYALFTGKMVSGLRVSTGDEI